MKESLVFLYCLEVLLRKCRSRFFCDQCWDLSSVFCTRDITCKHGIYGLRSHSLYCLITNRNRYKSCDTSPFFFLCGVTIHLPFDTSLSIDHPLDVKICLILKTNHQILLKIYGHLCMNISSDLPRDVLIQELRSIT